MPEHLWGMTSIPSQMDDSLATAVAQATAGDEAAFARIVRAHHADMTRVCFVICGDLDLADEAVGAAWPIAWRKLGSLRDPDRLRPWLVSVAANEARQLLRRQRRRTVVELSVATPPSSPDPIHPAAPTTSTSQTPSRGSNPTTGRSSPCATSRASTPPNSLGRPDGPPSGTRARLGRLLARLRTELGDD